MSKHVSVRGVIIKDDKLLCVRLKGYRGKIKGDFWCLPGGGVEDNESINDAIQREMVEETGVTPHIGQILYVHELFESGKEILEFFYHITNPDDYTNIDLSKTSHGEAELQAIEFIDPKTNYILPRFLSTEPLAQVIAEQKPPKTFSYPSP